MTLLQGLHGTFAVVLICTLLFVDEAGLPLPIAPNEALLLLTGVLVASGIASILGLLIGRAVLPLAKAEQAPQLGGQDPHAESP